MIRNLYSIRHNVSDHTGKMIVMLRLIILSTLAFGLFLVLF
ncbi:MAG: hypothetical protein WD035_06700 [Balneolaceae bacterium]